MIVRNISCGDRSIYGNVFVSVDTFLCLHNTGIESLSCLQTSATTISLKNCHVMLSLAHVHDIDSSLYSEYERLLS